MVHAARPGRARAAPISIGGEGPERDPDYPRRVGPPSSGMPIDIVAAPSAPAGSPDPSRRWALRLPGGAEGFPGVTPLEGRAAAPALEAMEPQRREAALIAITLPVVLSDGAGPYLLDADGRITLVLGPHPAIPGASLAMGEAAPDHRIGLVRPVAGPVWEWIARAEVAPEGRVEALDALDAVADAGAAAAWARGHGR